eukprot:scaffold26639_cov151-Skeletonema_menzelii.AAC.20
MAPRVGALILPQSHPTASTTQSEEEWILLGEKAGMNSYVCRLWNLISPPPLSISYPATEGTHHPSPYRGHIIDGSTSCHDEMQVSIPTCGLTSQQQWQGH